MNMFTKFTSRIPRILYFMLKRIGQSLVVAVTIAACFSALMASIMYTIKVTGSEAAGIVQLILICMVGLAYFTVWMDKSIGKKIPNALKATVKRFLIICAILAAVVGVLTLIGLWVELSLYWFGSPVPFIVLVATIGILVVIFNMAKEDASKEREKQDKVLEELSKE